ncbi:MAG: hypothetical protein ACE5HE_10910 [Phycisphaerae bacterium]
MQKQNGLALKLLMAALGLLCTIAMSFAGYSMNELSAHRDTSAKELHDLWKGIAEVRENTAVLPHENAWLAQRLDTMDKKFSEQLLDLNDKLDKLAETMRTSDGRHY